MSNTPPSSKVFEVLVLPAAQRPPSSSRAPEPVPTHLPRATAAVESAEGHRPVTHPSYQRLAVPYVEVSYKLPPLMSPSALPTPSHSVTACPRIATLDI